MAFPSPSLAVPSLSSWQFQFQGLTFGAGQQIRVAQVQGLGDLATLRTGDQVRARDHGELPGLDVYGGRDVTFTLEVQDPGTGVATTLSTLAAATEVGLAAEQPLWFQIPNYPLLCVMARARKRTMPWDVGYQIGKLGVVQLQFHCTDPRVYAAPQTVTVSLPNPSTTGITFPVTYPVTFGSVSPSGATVMNNGNSETRPLLVITGPVTSPTIVNSSITGSPALSIANPNQTGYTVFAGDQLVIDTDLHSVMYYTGGVSSGTTPASRGSWVVAGSTWWDLTAGANLIQFLSKDSVSVAGTCQVQWASAYQL